ncbi:MAG: SPOR domain-containing protein, partial [Saprospiraceae bacterium]
MLRYLLIPLSCLICSGVLAQDFRVQLTASADTIAIAYFQNLGVQKVMVSTDNLGIYRYFSGVYSTREQAEKVLEGLVAKGFPGAVIIDLEEQRALCSMTCPYNRPGHPVFLEHVG